MEESRPPKSFNPDRRPFWQALRDNRNDLIGVRALQAVTVHRCDHVVVGATGLNGVVHVVRRCLENAIDPRVRPARLNATIHVIAGHGGGTGCPGECDAVLAGPCGVPTGTAS